LQALRAKQQEKKLLNKCANKVVKDKEGNSEYLVLFGFNMSLTK